MLKREFNLSPPEADMEKGKNNNVTGLLEVRGGYEFRN